MKREILFGIILFTIGARVSAQNTFPSTGNVGIGTTNHSSKLEVSGPINLKYNSVDEYWLMHTDLNGNIISGFMRVGNDLLVRAFAGIGFSVGNNENRAVSILTNGNIGIGTVNPMAKLEIVSSSNKDQISLTKNTIVGEEGPGIVFRNLVNDGTLPEIAKIQSSLLSGTSGAVAGSLSFFTKKSSLDILAMTIVANGDIGIGTSVPKEKLSVNGSIRAKEVKVETANWPDYVFEVGYKLTSLKDLEFYIKNNGHLPGIPTAQTIEKEGIALSETIKAQQKIIEELTLHLIQKDKELIDSNKRIDELDKKVEIILKKIKE